MQTYWWLSEVPRSIATSHFKAPDALSHERSSLPPPDTVSRAVGKGTMENTVHEVVSVTNYQNVATSEAVFVETDFVHTHANVFSLVPGNQQVNFHKVIIPLIL